MPLGASCNLLKQHTTAGGEECRDLLIGICTGTMEPKLLPCNIASRKMCRSMSSACMGPCYCLVGSLSAPPPGTLKNSLCVFQPPLCGDTILSIMSTAA